MTTTQKQQIEELRGKGETYAVIAETIGVSENTVKSYCRRNGIEVAKKKFETCPECGMPLMHIPHKRQKRFCSDKCRLAWWEKHPEGLNRKAIYHFVCLNCGTSFTAYGNSKRKYCSRSCASAARRASYE